MLKTKSTINNLLKEVRGVLKRRVRLSNLDVRLSDQNETLFMDDVLVPEAVEQYLYRHEFTKFAPPEVIVTNRPILGNLFFMHMHSHNITICSLNDWELYSPPSIRAFLLYTGICSLLHYKYNALSHYSTTCCILDRCKYKTDIKRFLSPSSAQRLSPFCEECDRELNHVYKEIKYEINTLFEWIKDDFKVYTENMSNYRIVDRTAPRAYTSLQGVKELREIDLFHPYSLRIHPIKFVYKYIQRIDINTSDEIFKYLKQEDVQLRISVEKEE